MTPAVASLLHALVQSTDSPSPGVTLVGVGPGDPRLLTLAALEAIAVAGVVAYPVAQRGGEGMAARIAEPWIRPHQRRLPLHFPMVEDVEPRRQAWHRAADALAAEVDRGQVVVLLCEGDASLFASASYVVLAMADRHPACPLRVVPGISAVAAAAAAATTNGNPWPLALQRESLLICPTPNTVSELEHLLEQAASATTVLALLKLAQRWRWVRPCLAEHDLLQGALFASKVGWPDERVVPAAEIPAEEQPYFSLLLLRQSWPAVLP